MGKVSPKPIEYLTHWLNDIICRPDTRLLRPGAICPCLSEAIKVGKLSFDEIRLEELPYHAKKQKCIQELRNRVAILQQTKESGQSAVLDCVAIVLSNVLPHEVRGLMNETYSELRGEFLSKGFMFGAFHSHSRRHSRLNRDYFPMRSELPIFAIRRATAADATNLVNEPEYYKIYRQYFKNVNRLRS